MLSLIQKRKHSARSLRASVFERSRKPRRSEWGALLAQIWGLTFTDSIWLPSSYVRFYNSSIQGLDRDIVSFSNRQCVLDVLAAIKDLQHLPLSQMKKELEGRKLQWSLEKGRDYALDKGIEFFIRLWLLVEPRLDPSKSEDLTLKEIVRTSLPSPNPAVTGHLSPNLKEKNLARIGGMEIIYTSYLNEHLECVDGSKVKVFAHASLLRQYSQSDESNLYPPDFLHETIETLELLLPTTLLKDARRTRRLRDRDDVDIEAQLPFRPSLSLQHYKYWGERLREIGRQYDQARPKRAYQWWFDRRNRVEWATLQVALLVFCLTVFFGVISSVTGVMQVYASFQALKEAK